MSRPSDAQKRTEMMNHWLLNTAVEFPVPILYFFPKVSQALNVKPMPGCTSEDYARGLIGLFDLGMITFSSKTPGDDTANRAGILQILKRSQELPIEDGTLPSYKKASAFRHGGCFQTHHPWWRSMGEVGTARWGPLRFNEPASGQIG